MTFAISRGTVPRTTSKRRQDICNCFSSSPRLQKISGSAAPERIPCKSFIHKDFLPWPSRSPKESLKNSLKITQKLKQWPYSGGYFCLPSFTFKSLRKYMSLLKKISKSQSLTLGGTGCIFY